jgi:hypothetical protein
MKKPGRNLTVLHLLLHNAARILSICSLAFLFLFLVGERGSQTGPWELTGSELLLFALFPVGLMVSLLLAWRWPRIGGLLAILCMLAFYGLHYAQTERWPQGTWFIVLASPALLFVLAGLLPRRAAQRE